MTGRRALLIVILIAAFSVHLRAAAEHSVIVEIAPGANISKVARALSARVLDNIPGTNTYLLSLPLGASKSLPLGEPDGLSLPLAPPNILNPPLALPNGLASVLGIQRIESNLAVTLPRFAQLDILVVPGTTPANWYKDQPSMRRIRAGEALEYSTGRGVVVADINSRVDYGHPALAGHLTGGYDFVATRPDDSSSLNQSSAGFLDQSSAGFLDQSSAGFLDQSSAGFLDQSSAGFLDSTKPAYGHATLCAGIIAVVAPDSLIMPVRAFDEQGRSDVFTLAKAIRYAVQNGAQVINMSFGTLDPSPTLQSAIEFARLSNILLTASAGNDNTSNLQYPAAFTGVMTAAATDLFDKKASFSNFGDWVFVDAPGVNIISAYPLGYYGVVSGTSFSAPALAGTAALVRSLQTVSVPNAIAAGAVNIDSNNPEYAGRLGHGRIDVLEAVHPD